MFDGYKKAEPTIRKKITVGADGKFIKIDNK
jgi:hypothetical protein